MPGAADSLRRPTTGTRRESLDPSLCSDTGRSAHELLRPLVRTVWDQYFEVYGAAMIWTQLNRGGIRVARCTDWPV